MRRKGARDRHRADAAMSGLAAGERLYALALRARSLARWVVGAAIATVRYLARTTRVDRDVETRSGTDTGPVDRPVGGDQESLQPRSEGAGASVRRRYRIVVRDPEMGAEDLIDAIARDPNLASPFEVARFVKTSGRLGEMREGDEYVVWMPGPWNGPVRVAERTATSFRLATMTGHMEAGEIEFRAAPTDEGLLFEIESAARSGSAPASLIFGPLRFAAEIQLHMWAHFCERTARIAGGTPAGPVRATTVRYPDDRGEPSRTASPRAMRALERLQRRELNFDPAELDDAGPATGWQVDDHSAELPPEPPGPPVPGGSWEVARRLIGDYRFADPTLIEAVYYPSQRLEDRNMLLEGRFLGMRFLLGVRVAAVIDETRDDGGRPVREWGWSYRTLEGHLERGQMRFSVEKRCDTGQVLFRIAAVSQVAPIANPVVRLGFRIFGRRLQVRFADRALARMRELVEAELREGHDRVPREGAVEAVPVPTRRRPDD